MHPVKFALYGKIEIHNFNFYILFYFDVLHVEKYNYLFFQKKFDLEAIIRATEIIEATKVIWNRINL